MKHFIWENSFQIIATYYTNGHGSMERHIFTQKNGNKNKISHFKISRDIVLGHMMVTIFLGIYFSTFYF